MNKALLSLFICITFLQSSVCAEDNLRDLKGLKKSALINIMGLPDSKEQRLEEETWLYGQSLVFIKDGIVVSWSDSGNLRSRANLALIRDTSRSDYEIFSRKWSNLWTPKKITTQKEVLDLLISKMRVQ